MNFHKKNYYYLEKINTLKIIRFHLRKNNIFIHIQRYNYDIINF